MLEHTLLQDDGVRLHVEPPTGDGELLVLVHGSWTDHQTWAALVPLLARSFRVVSYDRRGHSRSERGAGPAPRRRDEEDLAALIAALGAGPVHLVGSSYGALIALGLAGRRPSSCVASWPTSRRGSRSSPSPRSRRSSPRCRTRSRPATPRAAPAASWRTSCS